GQLPVHERVAPGGFVGVVRVARRPARQVVRIHPVDVGLRQGRIIPDVTSVDRFQVLQIEDVLTAAEREAQGDDEHGARSRHWPFLLRETSMPTAKVFMSGYERMLFISGSYPQSPRCSFSMIRFVPVKWRVAVFTPIARVS